MGQPQGRRRKRDFAWQNLFGIEIHSALGRICQTNLMLHKDGHTNIEVGRSCLDVSFSNPNLDPEEPVFTLIVGNPPFGDKIRKDDRDQLGDNHLAAFELAGGNQVSSEIAVIERAIKWLAPGRGRLGMVVPDGVLNNSGEPSRCPALRRFLFCNVQILAIVSLPDHAFRRSGAQNKTSLLFVRRWSEEERTGFVEAMARHLNPASHPVDDMNDLYSGTGFDVDDALDTVLGQYRLFRSSPGTYRSCRQPQCVALRASELFTLHPSHRIDAKYFTFKNIEEIRQHRSGTVHRLGDLVVRRRETVIPSDHPEREFKTITLSLEGELRPREAGKGRNPPGWNGSYFAIGTKWYVVREGDILASRIDLWKGCIGVVPPAFDGAIVTGEFPIYRVRRERRGTVDGRYLQILLRGRYFRRALRAVTTGHSNRRRTQEADFFDRRVPLPPLPVQEEIADAIHGLKARRAQADADLGGWLDGLDRLAGREVSMEALRTMVG